MHDPLRHDEGLAGRELHGLSFQVDEQATIHDVKEFVLCVVLVPVILSANHAQPHDGIVHLAECLVIPLIGTPIHQGGYIDALQRVE